ncbi:MAG: ankyrin repeat domain-containing protein [Syntrophales bacterium]
MLKNIWNKFHVGVFIDACKYGDEPQVFTMLEKEPELAYIKDKKGISALFYAVAYGHVVIADAILHVTSNIDDVEPEKGFTPLLIAATRGNTSMVRFLLEHGANPNIRNVDGMTALHNAVFEKHIEIVKLLLEYGADTTIKDRLGNTAFDLADLSIYPQLYPLFHTAKDKEGATHKGNEDISKIPSRYMLESKLASLIDTCAIKELEANNACISLNNDYSFSYMVEHKIFENQFLNTLARVFLKDVPCFEVFLMARKEYGNPQHPQMHIITDMYAIEAVKILLEHQSNIVIKEDGKDGDCIAYANGTVLHLGTGLMWAAKDNGCYIDWQNAKIFCESYNGGGYSDWRLPTIDELAGLYDESKSRPAACNHKANIHVITELIDITCFAHWASEIRGSKAAYFNFYNGSRLWLPLTDPYGGLRVLPVREYKEVI